MSYRHFFPLIVLGLVANAAHAQTAAPTTPPIAQSPKDCPPGVNPGQNADNTLSDKLASSKGVICPPAGVDPEMQQPPQSGGSIKVVPPPGSPGGDQSVQPK